MSSLDAAYRLAHAFPGGIAALAARMGRNANTLQNEVNPGVPTHKLGLADAELMTGLSRDLQIAQALALAGGGIVVPVAPMLGQGELSREIAVVGQEFGEVMTATQQAIEDGKVTARELANYEGKMLEMIGAMVKLHQSLKKLMPQPPGLKVAK